MTGDDDHQRLTRQFGVKSDETSGGGRELGSKQTTKSELEAKPRPLPERKR